MNLAHELADYDGKTVAILEGIAARFTARDRILQDEDADRTPRETALRQSIRLAGTTDENVAIGATWLLRRWLEEGVRAGPHLVHELASALASIPSHWASLHVCQSIALLDIPAADAPTFAKFLRHCGESDHPFLRAWATDGLVRLAAQHPAHAREARTALEAALIDPAPSVRARARRITTEK